MKMFGSGDGNITQESRGYIKTGLGGLKTELIMGNSTGATIGDSTGTVDFKGTIMTGSITHKENADENGTEVGLATYLQLKTGALPGTRRWWFLGGGGRCCCSRRRTSYNRFTSSPAYDISNNFTIGDVTEETNLTGIYYPVKK